MRRTWAAGLALVASLAYVIPAAAAEGVHPGRVANTDGANLRLRTAPDVTAPILKRLGPGWRLNVLGGPMADGQWLRVEHAGAVGYAAVDYIVLDGTVPAGASPAEPRRSGRVVNTDGANLRVRAAPDDGAPILKRLGPDWGLMLLGQPTGDGRWQRVEHGGVVGYVAAAYVTEVAAPAPLASAPPAPAASAPRAGWVANTEGATVRLRAAPSADAPIVKTLGPGWRVTILEGPITGGDGTAWVGIEHGGASGYVAAAYIAGWAAGGDAGLPPTGAGTPSPAAWPQLPGQRLIAREPVRLRTEPGLASTVIMRLGAGAAIQATGREARADGYRWLSVRALGRDGWIVADMLGTPPGPDAGRQLAAEALAQVGRPYVWGGETPTGGFDCSGLVRYVVRKITGVDLTHVLALQAEAGSPVDRDQLQVGDLVFHENTYKPGLSHVGFYVGNGQFVSAQNERVGVALASLDTPYWKARYYGARRMAE